MVIEGSIMRFTDDDHALLCNLYWDKELSLASIANQLNVDKKTVRRRMIELNIPRRKLNPNIYKDWSGAPHRDPVLLKRLYWDEELSTTQIAERFGVSGAVVGLWMRRHEIGIRDQALATHIAIGNSVRLSNEALFFLAGELLGDGSLIKNKSISAYYSHASKHRAYVEWLRDIYESFGIESVGSITKHQHLYEPTGTTSYTYRLITKSYPELMGLRRKWYPNEKKQPPRDLVLNGVMLRQWFIGDGNYREGYRDGYFVREVRISNFAFSRESQEFLLKLLHGLHLGATLASDGFRMRSQYTDRFFDIIGPCPVPDIYGYKWPSERITHRQLDLL